MELNSTITANSTTEQIQAAELAIETAIKQGYGTNAFGIKLPVGKWSGKATGLKPFRTWKKSETNKGTILSAEFNFDIELNGVKSTVLDKVNFALFADWKKVGKDSDITVVITHKSESDKTLVCKIVPTTVSDEIPTKPNDTQLPTNLSGWKKLYLETKGSEYVGTNNSKSIAKALGIEIS